MNSIIESIKEVDQDIEIYYISNDFSGVLEKNREDIIELKPTFEIEKILSLVDCVINGGGLIKYECSFCKIPSASLSTTKLQYEDTLVLKRKKMIEDLGFIESMSVDQLKENVKRFLINNQIRKEMIDTSRHVFTGQSIQNIFKLMA